MLNKRHNDICSYHVWELQTTGKIQVKWIPGDRNLSYLLTNNTMTGDIKHKADKWNTDKNGDGMIGRVKVSLVFGKVTWVDIEVLGGRYNE